MRAKVLRGLPRLSCKVGKHKWANRLQKWLLCTFVNFYELCRTTGCLWKSFEFILFHKVEPIPFKKYRNCSIIVIIFVMLNMCLGRHSLQRKYKTFRQRNCLDQNSIWIWRRTFYDFQELKALSYLLSLKF